MGSPTVQALARQDLDERSLFDECVTLEDAGSGHRRHLDTCRGSPARVMALLNIDELAFVRWPSGGRDARRGLH